MRDQRSAGEVVTETFDYDGGRQVTVYIPADPPEAVVFASDGQLIPQWGGVLEAAEAPSTMIVGVHRLADETLRLHEYSPGFDPERFAAHEEFFIGDVRRWARSRFGVALPADRTAVFGVSAGGELALAMGLRHPDVDSARVPRCGHAGAVLPRERDPMGGRAAPCRCGRCDDGAGRVAWRRVLARRVPADGGVGIWTVKNRLERDGSLPGYREAAPGERLRWSAPEIGELLGPGGPPEATITVSMS